jgi:hypothetical protein
MGYSWVSVDAETGNVLNDLPDLTDGSGGTITVAQTIGRYETVTASLPLPTAPPDWDRSTTPGAANLILLADNPNDSTHGIPVWGANVTQQEVNETDQVSLSLATLEAYFDRRYVGNAPFTNVGQNDIINSLVNSYIKVGPAGGIPIRVQYVTAGAGKLRTRTEFTDVSDKTIYSILTDLMSVQGGPEWTIGWEWQTAPERITPVLYVGDRIGSAVMAGMGANATFEMPGPVRSFKRLRDYSDGKGANSVIATSSGQGTSRPQSPAQLFADPIRPTYEYRWSPSTSISDVNTLTSWAQSALTQMTGGTTTLAMDAIASDPGCPQLGVDWFLGDDVGFNIGGPDANGVETVPGFPGGYKGTGRAIGYTLEVTETPIITPILTNISTS